MRVFEEYVPCFFAAVGVSSSPLQADMGEASICQDPERKKNNREGEEVAVTVVSAFGGDG
jgi:hypothetical protein